MKFQSLDSLRKKEEEEAKKKNEYYTGGAGSRGGSGLAVEGPNTGGGDIFSRIVKKAEDGGESMRGGESSDNVTHKIKLYRNGFVVNDGPFRQGDTPENKTFLEQLAMGYIPSELRSNQPGKQGEVDVGVEDLRNEDYVPPPPPAYVAYGGQGMVLSSSSTRQEGDGGVVDPTQLPPAPEVDSTSPTTTVQVKLLNGKKIRVKINTSHSVAQLCAHIVASGGEAGRFVLASGFPPKDLPPGSLEKSVADAGLQGASITLKNA